jgi:hypothetical protein
VAACNPAFLYLLEGLLHEERQDRGDETSAHPEGRLLSDNRDAEHAGESTSWPATPHGLRSSVIVWYCFCISNYLCAINIAIFTPIILWLRDKKCSLVSAAVKTLCARVCMCVCVYIVWRPLWHFPSSWLFRWLSNGTLKTFS